MNQINLIGNLGKDPELKTLNSGTEMVRFSLATTRSWKNKDGEKQSETQWHDIVFYGKQASVIAEYCEKGSKLRVTGEMRYKTVEQEDGSKRTYAGVVGSQFDFLSSKSSQGDNSNSKPKKKAASEDDDLPF